MTANTNRAGKSGPPGLGVANTAGASNAAGLSREDLLTCSEVGAIVRLTPRTVQGMCQRGDLPSVRAGRRVLVQRRHLVEWLERQAQRSPGGHHVTDSSYA